MTAVKARRRRLAHFLPVPPGDDCLSQTRCQELFRGGAWADAEVEHCRTCDWCWFFVTHDEAECLTAKQLIALSHGREPTDEEWGHLAVCPACAHDYTEIRA